MNLDLGEIRNQIDEVDKNIVSNYEKRMGLCKNVALYKIENDKEVLDTTREKQKLETVTALANDEEAKNGIGEVFSQIMATSRKMQYKLLAEHGKGIKIHYKKVAEIPKEGKKVVYQGVPGAYSYQAMMNYFGKEVDYFNVKTFKSAMDAVQNGEADYAVLPIENTTAGIVNDVYDLLIDYDISIVDQTDVVVRHALLGTKDATIEDIKTVYSHPQGLMQCSGYLEEHKEWQQIAQANTAGSAKKVFEEDDRSQAAIASTMAADIYGLKVLAENINRNNENTTRFIIVGKEKICKADAKKIGICFEIKHESGTLYNILSNFRYNGLNMTKIESRPIKDVNWEYRFFVEFEGDFEDEASANALFGIKAEASKIKILGNY